MVYNYIAPCLFGIEAILAGELREMGASNVNAENGRVRFSGELNILARANICSRYAERIQIILGEAPAHTFTQLFDFVKSLPLEDFIGVRDAFPVKGWSIDSKLKSIPDCQAIIKKAAAERLKSVYKTGWMEETGTVLQLQFAIHKDKASIYLDASGDGLHKRGYRENSGSAAPIKETLAAAMAYITRIYPDSQIYDPFCGSGTILIESALISQNMAPGMHRYFACEKYGFVPKNIFAAERARAADAVKRNSDFMGFGTDIDPAVIALSELNARKAGVSRNLTFKTLSLNEFVMPEGRAAVITNPPYGERLLDISEAKALYSLMGKKFQKQQGQRFSIISPEEDFEAFFGRKADKRRKLYNGMIPCQLYQYFK